MQIVRDVYIDARTNGIDVSPSYCYIEGTNGILIEEGSSHYGDSVINVGLHFDLTRTIIAEHIRRRLFELNIKEEDNNIRDMLNSDDVEMRATAILIIREKNEELANIIEDFFIGMDGTDIINKYYNTIINKI